MCRWRSNQSFGGSGGWPTVHTSTPAELFDHFHTGIGSDADPHTLRMRFSGIRKPRAYSTIEQSNASGWLLPDVDNVGAGDNNWNYSTAAFQDWYIRGHTHFLEDGMDFWWNDEGETQWFTYYWWNLAQQQE